MVKSIEPIITFNAKIVREFYGLKSQLLPGSFGVM